MKCFSYILFIKLYWMNVFLLDYNIISFLIIYYNIISSSYIFTYIAINLCSFIYLLTYLYYVCTYIVIFIANQPILAISNKWNEYPLLMNSFEAFSFPFGSSYFMPRNLNKCLDFLNNSTEHYVQQIIIKHFPILFQKINILYNWMGTGLGRSHDFPLRILNNLPCFVQTTLFSLTINRNYIFFVPNI